MSLNRGSPQSFALTGTGLAAAATIPLNISEAIHVSDTPALAKSILLPVNEVIHVGDAPALTESLVLTVAETIHVSDSEPLQIPVLIPLSIAEMIQVSDAASTQSSTILAIVESIHVSDKSVPAVPEPTSTTLNVSSHSPAPGQSVTLTASVGTSGAGTPTGIVNFYDGSALLCNCDMNNSKASFSAVFPAASRHSFTAAYEGDNNNLGSSSQPVTVTVLPLDFTLAVSNGQSETVTPGGLATYQITIDPLYGSYSGAVSFSASGLPPGATVLFSPATLPASAGQQTVTMTVQTSATMALLQHARTKAKFASLALALLLPLLLGARRWRSAGQTLRSNALLLVATLIAAAAASGCTNSNGFFAQPPSAYNISVTAASTGVQHTVVMNLTIE